MTSDQVLLQMGLKEDGWFRFDSIEFTLASGRKFRYKMTDYPFKATATEAEIDGVVCQLIKDKYKYCQWDREHPKTNQELEIYEAIRKWMLEMVVLAKQQSPADDSE